MCPIVYLIGEREEFEEIVTLRDFTKLREKLAGQAGTSKQGVL